MSNTLLLSSTYGIYLVISILITVWVGRTLNKNGRLFLVQSFKGNESIADSVNHLLLVGFYLINFGFISLTLKFGDKPMDSVGAIEFLSSKIGAVIIILGIIHFYNMHALTKYNFEKLFKINQQ